MTRQTELDRQWHETGYEELGIGFARKSALGTAKGIMHEMEETQPQDVLTCEDYDPDLDGPGHDLDTAKVLVNDCHHGPHYVGRDYLGAVRVAEMMKNLDLTLKAFVILAALYFAVETIPTIAAFVAVH